MTKYFLLFTLLVSAFFYSCTPDITTVQVVRNPSIKFTINGTSTWQNTSYNFSPVSQTVVYPQDTTKPGQLYNRLTLQAKGTDDKGDVLQLNIVFDVADANQLVGIYTPDYTVQRGLANVQVFNITDANNLAAYNLCTDFTTNAVLNIQKQKLDERLISGTFQMALCNMRDSTDKIIITNGVLTDITY